MRGHINGWFVIDDHSGNRFGIKQDDALVHLKEISSDRETERNITIYKDVFRELIKEVSE